MNFIWEEIVKALIFASFLFLCLRVEALVNVGGYVPFGLSTQKETTGSKNTLSFDPMVGVNTIFATPFYNQLFIPEFAMVFHGEGQDGYSKKTMLFLLDFGHQFGPQTILRYGIGTILTKVKSDGGTVTLLNGSTPTTFYKPDESTTSWNTTLNLGVEHSFSRTYALRFQTYWFSLLDSEARKVSYSLSAVYYL